MNRFLVFAGMQYYPFGGWSDYVGTFTTREEAMACIRGRFDGGSTDWAQLVDTNGGGFEPFYKDEFQFPVCDADEVIIEAEVTLDDAKRFLASRGKIIE